MTNSEIRTCYELKALGLDIPSRMKQSIRAHFKAQTDKLEKSIQDDWHRVYTDRLGESWCDYSIFADCGETDEELDDFAKELRVYNYSPCGCTGRAFTRWIHWKRMPIGIAFIHAMALDV